MARNYRSFRRNKTSAFGFIRIIVYSIGAIVLIVLSITLAFWFEKWIQEKEDVQSLKNCLQSLAEDLETDRARIASILHHDSSMLDSLITLSDQLKLAPRERNPGRILILYHVCMQSHRFFTLKNTYTYMLSNGKMDLAQDPVLKKSIINYYETADNLISYINTNQLLFYQTFNPFIHSAGDLSAAYYTGLESDVDSPDNFDYSGFQLPDPLLMNRLGIRNWAPASTAMLTMLNMLGWRATLIKNEIDRYQDILIAATELQSEIDTVFFTMNSGAL